MIVSLYNMTGWHTQASIHQEKLQFLPSRYNISRVLGYVPVAGILTGLIDIGFGMQANNLFERVCGIVRGILEIVGLGILFIIPDIAVSVHRHVCAEEPNAIKV